MSLLTVNLSAFSHAGEYLDRADEQIQGSSLIKPEGNWSNRVSSVVDQYCHNVNDVLYKFKAGSSERVANLYRYMVQLREFEDDHAQKLDALLRTKHT